MSSIAQFVVIMPRRFVLERMLTKAAMSNKGFISVAAAVPLMRAIKADSGGMGPQPAPPAVPHKLAIGVVQVEILLAYIVSFVIILLVVQRLYVYKYHFTPPSLQAYRQLIAARRVVQRGELLASDNHQQLSPFTPDPADPHSPEGEGEDKEGFAGPSGASPEILPVEEDRGMHLSSETLAWLEQDLRASSFRERERLRLSASTRADLPPSGKSFYSPIYRSNSLRAILPPEFELTLNDCSNRASQSARFSTRAGIAPSILGGDYLPSDGGPIFFYPRSQSSRALLPSEFELDDLNPASPNAGFTSVNRSSASAPASAGASPSTSRPGSHRRVTNPISLTSIPPPNSTDLV